MSASVEAAEKSGSAKKQQQKRNVFNMEPRIDRLSTLPAELISLIFSRVKMTNSRPFLEGLSRTLLPYQRKTLYRSTPLVTTESLPFYRLRQSIISAPTTLAPLIETLVLYLQDCERVEGEKKPLDPEEEEIEQFLATLSHVSHLSLGGNMGASLAICILSENYLWDARYLPCLHTLELTDVFQGWSKPLSYSHYTSLSRYQALETLSLSIDSDVDAPAVTKGPTATPIANSERNHKIKSLSLQGASGSQDLGTTMFLKRFPVLTSLKINASGLVLYPDLFTSVSDTLVHLSIEHSVPTLRDVDWLEIILPKFCTLTSLTLSYKGFTSTVYDYLSRSPSIQTLTFGIRSDYTLSGVKQLIAGSARMKGLKKLVLHLPLGIGNYLYKRYQNNPDIELRSSNFRRWRGPQWQASMNCDDARELSRIREMVDIEIDGSLFDAIYAQEEYDKEKANLNRSRVEQGMTLV